MKQVPAVLLVLACCTLLGTSSASAHTSVGVPVATARRTLSMGASVVFPGSQGCATVSGSLDSPCMAPAGASGPVTYHGGPVMHDVVAYAVFWLPPGYSYDNPAVDPGSINASSSNYEAAIVSFLRGVGGSSYQSVLQQYPDRSGQVGDIAYGGSWVDSTAFPSGRGSQSDPLVDDDIINEVLKSASANEWNPRNGNTLFLVFTPFGVYEDGLDSCAWHSWWVQNSTTYAFAYMMDSGNPLPSRTCSTPGVRTPHNSAFADFEVNVLSHELVEAATDPQANAWYYGDVAHEIADECRDQFGTTGPDGGDQVLGGSSFLLQELWSNAANGCYLPPPSEKLTVSYRVIGGSSAVPSPYLSFQSGGLQFRVPLAGPARSFSLDDGTFWHVTPRLSRYSVESWATPEAASGTANASVTLNLTYIHQFMVQFSYRIFGDVGQSVQPYVAYVSLGSEAVGVATATGSPGLWVDAGTSFSYVEVLTGSTSTERWFAQSANGTVSGPTVANVTYRHQYLLTLRSDPQEGGVVPAGSGWVNQGTDSVLWVHAAAGWRFDGWEGAGRSSYTGDLGNTTVAVNGPINESAVFIPGVKLVVGPGVSVTLAAGAFTSTFAPGTATTVYFPKGTKVTLVAHSVSLLYVFNGWRGLDAGGLNATFALMTPVTLDATSGLSPGVFAIAAAAAAAAVLSSVALVRRRRDRAIP